MVAVFDEVIEADDEVMALIDAESQFNFLAEARAEVIEPEEMEAMSD